MPDPRLSRRQFLLAGAALALAACTKGERSATGAAASSQGLWYVAQPGDTLPGLAKRAGLSTDAIINANRLTSAVVLPGQRLWLPGVVSLPPVEPAAVEVPKRRLAGGRGYEIVPRSAWTEKPVGANNNPMGEIRRLTVHHTDEHGPMATLPDIEVVRRIENYHRSPKPHGRGWSSIGYHYLVGRDGRIYEGRPTRYQGAHVSGANENNLGISVIGNFMNRLPNEAQLAALGAFLDDQRSRYGVARKSVYGHRDLGSSDCPGDALYGWVKSYKAG